VPLIVGARLPAGVQPPQILQSNSVRGLGILNGAFSDFTADWYVQIGSIIVFSMVVNAVTAPLTNLLEYFQRVLPLYKARTVVGYVVNQAELDQYHVGGEFQLSSRFPVVFTCLLVAIMYSAGMPLLTPIAFVSLGLMYWTDRWLILRFARKPPAFDAKLASRLLNALPLLVFLHSTFAVWMFSADGLLLSAGVADDLILVSSSVFGTNTTDVVLALQDARSDVLGIAPRVLRKDTFPHFLLALAILVGTLAYYWSMALWRLCLTRVGNADCRGA